MRFYHHKTRK